MIAAFTLAEENVHRVLFDACMVLFFLSILVGIGFRIGWEMAGLVFREKKD